MAQNSSWDWPKAKADEQLRAKQSKPAFLQELSNFLDEPNVPLPVCKISKPAMNFGQ